MEVKLADFASSMGVSPQAVRKAIKEGRIKNGVKKGRRGYLIDTDIARQEWGDNTDSSQQRPREAIGDLPPNINYSKARAYGEQFKAKLLELEFREKAGQLIKVDDAKIAQFKVNRMFRDAVQNIPIRIQAEIAAVMGNITPEQKHEILLIMQREINNVLTRLADSNGPK